MVKVTDIQDIVATIAIRVNNTVRSYLASGASDSFAFAHPAEITLIKLYLSSKNLTDLQ